MHLLSSALLSVSSSLDNLGVAIAFGMRKIRLPFISNLIIAVMTSLGTYISMKAGEYVFTLMPTVLANYLSSGIMIAAGGWVMFQSRAKPDENNGKREKEYEVAARDSVDVTHRTVISVRIKSLGLLIYILREPATVDRDYSGSIDFKEAFLLGLALTLNNLAGGIGGGMAGLNPELTATLTLITSLIFFVTGMRVGHNYFSNWIGERASQMAGLVLIAIGVYELFV